MFENTRGSILVCRVACGNSTTLFSFVPHHQQEGFSTLLSDRASA